MLTDRHIEKLKAINSIERLFDFLRDELHWPIQEGHVNDLAFIYSPDELGIKDELAPKVNKVYQIRPLTGDQPWGIFFIDFENKKLPVTLMRRILNHLRVKNRGRSGHWEAGDLLFMTTYGEEAHGMREVAFAHFHQQEGDLPTLNVLQWDAQDTEAKLKTTYDTLRNHLGWPPDTNDQAAWRQQWRQPFKHKVGHVIRTAKGLAEKLAELSRNIRDSVNEVLKAETEKGPVTKLYRAFKEALIHDLKPEDFADTFAQTITYGLFSAAVSRRFPEDKGTKSLTTETISEIVPETNPFLREVLATFLDVGGRKRGGIDFDELGVQDVVELLRSDETDMKAILEDFGNRKQGEDPVIHFYEDYLKAYNKELKVKRGVFYTPQPVVSYIVRSVNELLQTEFGLEDGLASTITWGEMAAKNPDIKIPEGTKTDDPFVVVLDPATGTATFLVEVIAVIHKHLSDKWTRDREACIKLLRRPTANGQPLTTFQDYWNEYVPDHLLPRLYGYELMMAPYAIAHMKVGLKLGETGYRFGSSQRVRIYLTNALEPASELQARLALDWDALAHEAMAVKAVKETQRFTVVIGNPPYSGISSNMTPEAQRIVDAYKLVDGEPLNERKHWLQDDYVKFIRLAQTTLSSPKVGILGFITNHGYVANPTFRGMRRSLMQSFDELRILDLHGNTKKKEVAPDGSRDENVFDIQQGVAVCLLIDRGPSADRGSVIFHSDLYGTRETKYDWLVAKDSGETAWGQTQPNKPHYLFGPQDQVDREEYERGYAVPDIFPINTSGIVTARDGFVIDFEDGPILDRLATFLDDRMSDQQIADDLNLSENYAWTVRDARKQLRECKDVSSYFKDILYRPFDFRRIVLHPSIVFRVRKDVMRHMLAGPNVALATTRSIETERGFEHAWTTGTLIGHHSVSLKEVNYLLPLYSYPTEKEVAMGIGKEPNLSPAFLDAMAGALGRRFEYGGSSADPGGLFAEGAEPSAAFREPSADSRESSAELRESLAGSPESSAEPREWLAESRESSAGPRESSAEPRQSSADARFSPEDVFHYIYAVLHSPAYRSRYAEFLKIDFPRIPLPGSAALFDALVPLGAELVALHLMESPRLNQHMTTFEPPRLAAVDRAREGEGAGGEGSGPRVEKVTYSNGTVYIDKAQTIGFYGVPEEVWNFHIGGYQVCEKWLKDRGPKGKEKDKDGKEIRKPGRILSPEDIDHYHRIVVALSETIRIMKEIDVVIEQHGGWPEAFHPKANTT